MYWDSLTEVGLLVSIVLMVGAFYLVIRERPVDRHNDLWKI